MVGPPAGRVDWESIASLVVERVGAAVFVLDDEGTVCLANQASATLLGCDAQELVGSNFLDRLVPEARQQATASMLERAGEGTLSECLLRLRTHEGELEVPAEASTAGDGLVLSIASSVLADVREARSRPEVVVFEIETQPRLFGTIRFWQSSRPGAAQPPARERCFRWLYGLGSPCTDCICGHFPPERSTALRVVPRDGAYEIQTARRAGDGRVRVSLQRIDDSTRARLFEAHVATLARGSALSTREREVLQYLLVGAGVENIAKVLGVTPRTVRFHQANLLAKLGAESRADLVRLLV